QTLTVNSSSSSAEDKDSTQTGDLYQGDYAYNDHSSATFSSSSTQQNQTSTTTESSTGSTTAHQTDTGNKKQGQFFVTVESETHSTQTQDAVNLTQTTHTVTNSDVFEDSEKSGDITGKYGYDGIRTSRTLTVKTA